MNRLDLKETRNGVCGKCGEKLAFDSGVTELPSVTLHKALEKSPNPVLVDFWAPWCGPCRAFAPTFKKAAHELGEKLLFAKVNTEEAHGPELGSLNIRSIPTLILFKNGKEIDRVSGALPESELKRWINSKI